MTQIADSTLGSPAATHSVALATSAYNALRILFVGKLTTANGLTATFNSDTANNYRHVGTRIVTTTIGTADYSASRASINLSAGGNWSIADGFSLIDISNFETLNKQFSISNVTGDVETGKHSGYWANTTAQISQLTITGASNIAAGSRIIVWGLT